jgi:uncharacterized membrane protein
MGFFEQYFVDPIIQGTGYNIYNTIVYAVLLVIAVLVTFELMKKMKINIDSSFAKGVIPFIVLGGVLRAMEDAGVVSGFVFKTPLIYGIIFVAAFVSLAISKLIENRSGFSYYKIWGGTGALVALAFIVQVQVSSTAALVYITVITAFWIALLSGLKKISERNKKLARFFSKENTALLGVHMFDATTTFVALNYFPYFEQHVLPSFLISIFGPAVMFVLKFVVISAVLYLLDKEMREDYDREKRNFIKLAILILGLAPGLRNALRLVMQV